MTGDYPLGADCDTDAIRDQLAGIAQRLICSSLDCRKGSLAVQIADSILRQFPDFPASGAGMVAGSEPGLPATPTT